MQHVDQLFLNRMLFVDSYYSRFANLFLLLLVVFYGLILVLSASI